MPTLIEKIKEGPILMNGEMVRATLADIKTHTRRVINHLCSKGPITEFGKSDTPGYDWHFRDSRGCWNDISDDRLMDLCPHGNPGTQLWVRETWRLVGGYADTPIKDLSPIYKNDLQFRADRDESYIDKYHPSIFMPRWASRIDLEIVDIRVERVQDISEQDARAEGIDDGWLVREKLSDARAAYKYLWDSINAKRGYGWDVNPWVWVIVFRRVKE